MKHTMPDRGREPGACPAGTDGAGAAGNSVDGAGRRAVRLVRLPAKFTRRKEVLRYLAMRDFRPGARYTERQVNDVLRDWCEGAETDYVSVRRYLVDYGILDREDAGDYWLLGAWRVPAPQ